MAKRKGYEQRVSKYEGWFAKANEKGGKKSNTDLNAIMEEMVTEKCLRTVREKSFNGFPINKIRIGPKGAKLRKIHEKTNTRIKIQVPDTSVSKRKPSKAKKATQSRAGGSSATTRKRKTATRASSSSTARDSSKRQKNATSNKSKPTTVVIDDVLQETSSKSKKSSSSASVENEDPLPARIDSTRAMKELGADLEESLRAALVNSDATKSKRKRKLHNIFTPKLLIAICKMCPTELHHMNFFLDKGLRMNVNQEFGQLVVDTVKQFLIEHPDVQLNGEFPVVENRSAAVSEAIESAYFPGSQGSSGSPWMLSVHRRKKAEKEASKKASVMHVNSGGNNELFSDSDDDFELANIVIPKSKTIINTS